MASITTRVGKGSPLTNAEVDANFTNLNSDKLEVSTLGVTVQGYSTALENTTASFLLADETKLDGISPLAEVNPALVSQAEAEGGVVATERTFSALRVAQAISALAPSITPAEQVKLGFISVTSAVDLNDMNTRISAASASSVAMAIALGG
tara:strand:- start:8 stop:460 length:453 start_codon:yes stop_codon:yes gene_type:complete